MGGGKKKKKKNGAPRAIYAAVAMRAKKRRVSHFDRITIERSYPPLFQ
jgi:hypothetical protein